MANLLSDKSSREDFPILDPEQRSRFASRLRTLSRLISLPDVTRRLERRLQSLDSSLEELQADPSLVAAFDLLDQIERDRQAVLAESTDQPDVPAPSLPPSAPALHRGGIVCHWPGRSLSTGEANVASRGFYDLLDRPPLPLWLEAIARPTGREAGDFEIAILAWVPEAELDRARDGCHACTNGALAFLDSESQALASQLGAILDELDEQAGG